MEIIRSVARIVQGIRTEDGAGVKLVRVVGHADTKDFDPFLMLDGFDSVNPNDYIKGFPWHPHRGIETVTYLIRGNIEHQDSLGNVGSILDGDCQWMSAGSGIIHQEMPKASDRMLGAQLWINMPAKDKMTPPKYNGITADQIPLVDEGDRKIRVVAGSYLDTPGAFKGDHVDATYLDVELSPGAEWALETPEETTLFIYIFLGSATFGQEEKLIEEKNAVLFTDGSSFKAKATEKGIRFILLYGKPLREPIAWSGPIVMNTREELNQAFRELRNDTFIK